MSYLIEVSEGRFFEVDGEAMVWLTLETCVEDFQFIVENCDVDIESLKIVESYYD